jgi:hypothetical protein
MAETIPSRTMKSLSGELLRILFQVRDKLEVMEYYRDSSGFWRIKNFRRRRRARI